jgi:hypothetical protein
MNLITRPQVCRADVTFTGSNPTGCRKRDAWSFYPLARARGSYPGVQNGAHITIRRPETACHLLTTRRAVLYNRPRVARN